MMKKLLLALVIFAFPFVSLPIVHSADYCDSDNSARSSRFSPLKAVALGAALLSAPAEADVGGCYFGVASAKQEGVMLRVTSLSYPISCNPTGCSRCSVPENMYRNFSMDIRYSCLENTHCEGINIKQVNLCSRDFNITYRGSLIWNPQVDPSNQTLPCYNCFALQSFSGYGGRDSADFETAFRSVLYQGTCPPAQP